MTALFSLQVSSVMIGASQLHRTTTDTLTAITAGTLEDGQATTLHQWLITEAAEFTAAYTFLRHPPGPSPSN